MSSANKVPEVHAPGWAERTGAPSLVAAHWWLGWWVLLPGVCRGLPGRALGETMFRCSAAAQCCPASASCALSEKPKGLRGAGCTSCMSVPGIVGGSMGRFDSAAAVLISSLVPSQCPAATGVHAHRGPWLASPSGSSAVFLALDCFYLQLFLQLDDDRAH